MNNDYDAVMEWCW